ncbi:hypothetical protein NKH18_03495 [Streptomyces sp. M10(2022)]
MVLSDTYLTRNLVAAKAQARSYWVLTVSAEHATLWTGTRDELREEHKGGFPGGAARGAQPAARGADRRHPSTYSSEEARQFLRTVDESCARCLPPTPPALPGGARSRAGPARLGRRQREIGCLPGLQGCAPGTTAAELLKELRPALEDRRRQMADEIRRKLDNARGSHSFAGGLDEVWAAVREGRAGLVTVEEHFQQTVRVTDEHLVPVSEDTVQTADGQVREDIVDELVEAALDSGSEVVFVPDDSLAEHGRISAALRF